MPYAVRRIWTPALFRGGGRSRRYFEGWYFKMHGPDGARPMAVIPGIALGADGAGHAFVQLIEDAGATSYFEYALEDFTYSRRRFEVAVGPNAFSESGMSLDLAGPAGHVMAEIEFGGWSPWPVTALSPGIMGWYRFVPFMETYHGVLSMDHAVSGVVSRDGRETRYDGGRGYIEKDWGRSFPKAWLWAQCNAFEREGVSVTVSVAHIPWLRGSFIGYIAGVLVDGELHRFTTYTRARLEQLSIGESGAEVVLTAEGHELVVSLEGAAPGHLRGPLLGAMSETVRETIAGRMRVRLSRGVGSGKEQLLDVRSERAAFELMDPRGTLSATHTRQR